LDFLARASALRRRICFVVFSMPQKADPPLAQDDS
jgi:hypothetical protein